MIIDRIKNHFSIEYENKIIIFDDGFNDLFDYKQILIFNDFCIVDYDDVELFRYKYESEIKNSNLRWAIIVKKDIYVPYDIKNAFYPVRLSLKGLFPNLDSEVLREYRNDLDLISLSYEMSYSDLAVPDITRKFIKENIWERSDI